MLSEKENTFNKVIEKYLPEIIDLRRTLHKYPELSGKEFKTKKTIKDFFKKYPSYKTIEEIGETGLSVIYEGKDAGPIIMIRADIDALPINENIEIAYKSVNKNVSHKCGHDGHTAMVAGLACILAENPIKKGKLILLFQPAEETGTGAKKIINNPKFKTLKPDFIFGLHNIPGFEKNMIIIKNDTFALASKGIIIKLFGKSSHAAYPEFGVSPATAMTEIMQKLIEMQNNKSLCKDFFNITIIHARLGDLAFGTSPAYAEIMATIRSSDDNDMKKISDIIENTVNENSKINKINFDIKYTEAFDATVNYNDFNKIIKQAATEGGLKYKEIKEPFRWSEDFAEYTKRYKGAFFGIGAGLKHPQLHNPDYDFPDGIIETGIIIFYNIIKNYCY